LFYWLDNLKLLEWYFRIIITVKGRLVDTIFLALKSMLWKLLLTLRTTTLRYSTSFLKYIMIYFNTVCLKRKTLFYIKRVVGREMTKVFFKRVIGLFIYSFYLYYLYYISGF